MNEVLHLVSDLDGTWIRPCSPQAHLRALESHLKERERLVLTFATGRSLASSLSLLEAHVQFWPDHLITDMGTAIHHRRADGGWTQDADYAAHVAGTWDGSFLHFESELWRPEGLQPRPGGDSPFHLAFDILPGYRFRSLCAELQDRLQGLGVQVDVLGTHAGVDILPRGINKGSAALWLRRACGLSGPLVACGDTENDLELMADADVAILMPDAPLKTNSRRKRIRHTFFPRDPGPAGILQALRSQTLTYSSLS
nr:HAD family hydrolase [uncultured Holophaga sp.]